MSAPQKKAAPDPAVKRVIDAYHAAFLVRHGFKPIIHGGKDGAHVKQLLAAWGEPETLILVARFFATTEPRVLRSDYSLGALFSLAQYLRVERPDARTADNLHAAARAAGRRE